MGRDALEGKGPEAAPELDRRLDRRLEEVCKAVGGGYCRLQMPLKLTPAIRETVAVCRLSALERVRHAPPPHVPMHPCTCTSVPLVLPLEWLLCVCTRLPTPDTHS